MASFDEVTAWSPLAPGRWGTTIDPSWHQGRGAFGGLLAGAAVRAMEALVADPARALRTLHIHFAAPARGALVMEAEVLRAGNNVTHGSVRVTDTSGAIATFATAVLASERRDTLAYDHAVMPSVPSMDAAAPMVFLESAPRFVEHFDIRHVLGLPFSGQREPRLGAWVKLAAPAPTTVAVMAGLVDVMPAGACALMPAPRPIASIDFTLHVLDPQVRAHEGFLLTVSSLWAEAGYTEELRELWTADGRRIALCRQLIALL